MSLQYLLRCPCGETIPIGPSQAGGVVTCDSCGASQEAPRLRELRQLPVAEAPESPESEWSFRLGVVSFLVLVTAALAAAAGWFATTVPAPPEPFDPTARMEMFDSGVENMTPVQLWQSYHAYYEPMARRGMQQADSPREQMINSAIATSLLYRNILLAAAGVFALITIIAFVAIPK